jgi:hypothetical protein
MLSVSAAGDAASAPLAITARVAPRHFSSFEQAAQEAGMSRIYGGIHFMSDNLAGLQLGGEVGNYVLQNVLLPFKTGSKGKV